MGKVIYEFISGNNSPASWLRRIGTEEEFEKEEKRRSEKGYGFFETVRSENDVGERVQRREIVTE